MNRLLSREKTNPKLKKNGVYTWGLSLAPYTTSGYNLCPCAKNAGCADSCIGTHSGRGVMANVRNARIAKSKYFMENRVEFLTQLQKELSLADKYCAKKNTIGLVRLNVFSDINWNSLIDLTKYTNLRFYDYTKVPGYAIDGLNTPHYRRVYSYNLQTDHAWMNDYISRGGTVAVVFSDVEWLPQHGRIGKLPESWNGYTVIDGDATDDRFNDPKGVIVGLRLKGTKKARDNAKKGFAVKSVTLTVNGI